MERVMTTLSHKEPDRVPVFHMLTHYGAKELNIPIEEYFSKPEYVAEAQLLMKKNTAMTVSIHFFMHPLKSKLLVEKSFSHRMVRQILVLHL